LIDGSPVSKPALRIQRSIREQFRPNLFPSMLYEHLPRE
jgi:hypothetical protein